MRMARGTDRDYIQGYKWLCIASSAGNDHATISKKMVMTAMTIQQITAATKLASEWHTRSANNHGPNLILAKVNLDAKIYP